MAEVKKAVPREYDGTPYESTKTVAQCLADAKTMVAEKGWSQYAITRGGKVSVIRAMADATPGGFDQKCEVRDALRQAIGKYELGAWESSPKRELHHVYEALDLAIVMSHQDKED